MGAGLAAGGLGTYGLLALAGQSLGASGFGTFSAAWSLLLIAAAGLYIPLETETTRRLSADGAERTSLKPQMLVGAKIALVLAVVLAAAWPLVSGLLDGDTGVALAVPLLAAVSAVLMPLRGRAAATGSFARYSLSMTIEAAGRVLFVLPWVVVGAASPAIFALSLPVGALCAVVALLLRPVAGVAAAPEPARAARGRSHDDPPSRDPLMRHLGHLMIGALMAQALLNLPPLLIKAAAGSEDAGRILAGLSLARVPLFLAPAVLAPLLPRLVVMSLAGDHRRISRLMTRVMVALGATAAVGAAVAIVAGRPATGLVFGSELALPGRNVAVLVVGAIAFLAATTSASGLVALERHRTVSLGWATGLAALGASVALWPTATGGAAWGLAIGSALAAAVLTAALIRGTRHVPSTPAPTRADLRLG